MAPGSGNQKDLMKLKKKVEQLGKKKGDEGTYQSIQAQNKHYKVTFDYNGNRFLATFPSSVSDRRAIKNTKQQIKKSLKNIGFPNTPDFLSLQPLRTEEEKEIEQIVEELYRLLEEDDE
jgi:hypothetical protein